MKRQQRFSMLLLIALLLMTTPLAAEQGGLVIRSPLFTTAAVQQPEVLRIQSFADQLGLAPKKVVDEQDLAKHMEKQVLSAAANKEYPVTPGDCYLLAYLDGMETIVLDLQADEHGRIAIPGIGTVDGGGKRWVEVREEILALVRAYYSYSHPQLVLTCVGNFSVRIVGEVTGTRVVSAWGLTRLSEVVDSATPYASTRAVEVRSVDGSVATYDLYRALRKGDLTQDPLLKSGDVVTLKRAEKLVQLGGNVYQGGTYQLLADDTLETLLQSYGGGLLSGSDVQRIRIQRTDPSGQLSVSYVSVLDEPDFVLAANDQVIVDALLPSMQSVVIEGAITTRVSGSTLSPNEQLGYASNRLFYQFYPQETLGSLLHAISGRLMTISDLSGVYLERDAVRTAVDVQAILFGNSDVGQMRLQAGDTLVIPFSQRFITISGAVVRNGVYAYVPEKGINYYLALAGGISDDAAYPRKITVYGPDGKKQKSDDPIQPESTITVAKQTIRKDLDPTLAVIGLVSAILAVISTSLAIVAAVKKL